MGEDVAELNQLVETQCMQGGNGRLKHSTPDAAASFLMKTAGAKGNKDELIDLLVLRQQREAEADDRKLSYEEAHEEWVADSMETMLTDGTIMEKLSMLQAKDKSLVEKIKTFLKDFVKRLKDAYSRVNPQTVEGQIVADMVDAAQELQDLFADALIDAGENFQKAEKNTTGEGGVRHSIRRDIVDINGKEYDSVVELDKEVPQRVLSEPKRLLGYIKQNFLGLKFPVLDENGNIDIIEFAGEKEVAYKGDKKNPVLGELAHTTGDTRKQVVVNAVEVINESAADPDNYSSNNDHGWLDENGWKPRKTYVLAQDGNIYEAQLKIARIRDGRNILYAVNLNINKGVAVDKSATQKRAAVIAAMPSKEKIQHLRENVKENDSTEKRTSSRSGSVSDRAMLVDLFEQTITDSNEYKALQNYKKNIDRMMALEEHLQRISEEIKRISFAERPRDMEELNNLKLQQKNAVRELNRYDNVLLGLEKSGVLRAMVERNRRRRLLASRSAYTGAKSVRWTLFSPWENPLIARRSFFAVDCNQFGL